MENKWLTLEGKDNNRCSVSIFLSEYKSYKSWIKRQWTKINLFLTCSLWFPHLIKSPLSKLLSRIQSKLLIVQKIKKNRKEKKKKEQQKKLLINWQPKRQLSKHNFLKRKSLKSTLNRKKNLKRWILASRMCAKTSTRTPNGFNQWNKKSKQRVKTLWWELSKKNWKKSMTFKLGPTSGKIHQLNYKA